MTRRRDRSSFRWVLALALGLAPLASSATAHADPTAEERAAARALFAEARTLMAAGNYAPACPKLEESQRIDPGIGTQFNLADCQEHTGKLASAWANYLETASRAKAAGQPERADVASERAAALAPRLTRLVIVVAPGAPAALEVKRDGHVVSKGAWGTALPVDPGEHVVTARAPGKKAWQGTVIAKGEGASITLEVPPLVDLPPEPPRPLVQPAAPAPAPQRGLGGQRIAALTVGGAAVVSGVIGVALGIVAKSKYDESLTHCPDPEKPNVCRAPAQSLRDGAITAGHGSTVAFAIAGAALAGGVALWFTAPSRRGAPGKGVGVTALIGAEQAGLGVTGRF